MTPKQKRLLKQQKAELQEAIEKLKDLHGKMVDGSMAQAYMAIKLANKEDELNRISQPGFRS